MSLRKAAGIFSLFCIAAGISWLGLSAYIAWQVTVPPRISLNDFHDDWGDKKSPAAYGMSAQEIRFTTVDGLQLSGWYIPGVRQTTVIVVEGWGQNRNKALPFTALFHDLGFSVLSFDFRGQGASDFGYCTLGVREVQDIAAAVRYLTTERQASRIVLFGVSMGGQAILRYLSESPAVQVRAAIVDSAYTSPRRMLQSVLAYKLSPVLGPLLSRSVLAVAALRVGYLSDISSAALRRVRVPVLVIHGAADREILPEQSVRIAAAVPGSQLVLFPEVRHGLAYRLYPEKYRQTLVAFLKAFAIL